MSTQLQENRVSDCIPYRNELHIIAQLYHYFSLKFWVWIDWLCRCASDHVQPFTNHFSNIQLMTMKQDMLWYLCIGLVAPITSLETWNLLLLRVFLIPAQIYQINHHQYNRPKIIRLVKNLAPASRCFRILMTMLVVISLYLKWHVFMFVKWFIIRCSLKICHIVLMPYWAMTATLNLIDSNSFSNLGKSFFSKSNWSSSHIFELWHCSVNCCGIVCRPCEWNGLIWTGGTELRCHSTPHKCSKTNTEGVQEQLQF